MNKIFLWCARQVEMQKDSPIMVYYMFQAHQYSYWYGIYNDNEVTEHLILKTFELASANRFNGYRKIPITINGFKAGSEPAFIRDNILNLIKSDLSPENFYQELERIHPFEDCNGRVGALLYNYMKGTLLDPVDAPPYTGKLNLYEND